MERKKTSDFSPAVLKDFDLYVHGLISRREFLNRSARFAVGGVTAAAILDSLQPNFAWAQQVAKDDSRIKAEYVEYPSPKGNGTMKGYLARPANASGPLPAVVVIHENRGLNPYIEDVVRRLALEGYLAFAPDALAVVGGYPGDEDKAREMFARLDPGKRTEDMVAAAEFLKAHPESSGKLGVIGFCYGGGVAGILAVRMPDLAAAVPFYGAQPPASEVAAIKAPLQIHYAGLDDRINAGWPAFEKALKDNGKTYEMHMYDDVHHGFHNDTTPRYDEKAASLAWRRSLDFFDRHLKS
ncbi:dienelactone hydrolase family protein [Advenella alkanexedens]|uniref:Dienelactone hydrolase family protein n=1 Tax=Advenella alkanexedens TaxID=1481665 RepID=A0ABS6NLP4_9BURK|nr:dienelactone hydrolase family protein [Advenella alkanexedens]MBV4396289.1 dienelactone hydrolase family protein [Advenella alkanexedens]